MLIPVRCFTCGKPISNYWIDYTKLLKKYEKDKTDIISFENIADSSETACFKALKELKITRMCCRRHFITNVDMLDSI